MWTRRVLSPGCQGRSGVERKQVCTREPMTPKASPVAESPQRMGEKRGGGEQGQGDRELRHDEKSAQAIAEASGGIGASQGGVQVEAGGGPGGSEGEEAGCGHGDGGGECQGAPFEGEREKPGGGGRAPPAQ